MKSTRFSFWQVVCFGLFLFLLVVIGALLSHVKRVYAGNYTAQFPYIVREVSPAASHHVIEQSILSQYVDSRHVLVDNKISVFSEDRVYFAFEPYLPAGGIITIERAPVIHVTDGKRQKDVRSWKTKVSELLDEQKIPEIGKDDKISVALEGEVSHDMSVVIVRVQETDVIVKEAISFQTIEKTDATLERGKTKVTSEGRSGTKQYTYHIRREDGLEVWRKLTKTEITTPKEDRIIVKGTKLIIGRTQRGSASWYSSRYLAASNLFARGTNVRVTNTKTGKSIETKIEDHMASRDKVIDLHPSIFTQLGATLGEGIQPVLVEEVLN